MKMIEVGKLSLRLLYRHGPDSVLHYWREHVLGNRRQQRQVLRDVGIVSVLIALAALGGCPTEIPTMDALGLKCTDSAAKWTVVVPCGDVRSSIRGGDRPPI